MEATGGDASEATRTIFNRGLKSGKDEGFFCCFFFWNETAPQVSQEQLSQRFFVRTFCSTTVRYVSWL